MIELSVIDLFYMVLTFFVVILGTLGTLVLLRLLKILAVATELAGYYWNFKKVLTYYAFVPFVLKEKIFSYFSKDSSDESETASQKSAK